jgi:uncharacterized integral membrane protein
MIMRQGQQLLLPANPVFIWASLIAAMLLNMLQNMGFVGRAAWTPDLLAVVLVFWTVHQPLRISIGGAFVFGLLMDVHQGGLHRVELLCHHHSPAVAVVLIVFPGSAGVPALCGGARRRMGRAHGHGRVISGLVDAVGTGGRGRAVARGQFGTACAATARTRSGCEPSPMKTHALAWVCVARRSACHGRSVGASAPWPP